jgi:GPH family glycoside/pentoside/hexuronide:cation symporter
MTAIATRTLSAYPGRLSSGALGAYALFGLPLMMTALPLNILLPDFYAAQTGMTLAVIGTVMLATRLIDAVADPLLGVWVDAEKTRASYTRPLLLAAPVLVLAFWLLFDPPAALRADGAALWLFITLAGAYVGFSLASVAYQAWGAELAHDDAGRTRIVGSREAAGLLGVLIGGSLPQIAGYHALVSSFTILFGLLLALLLSRAPRPPASGNRLVGNPYLAFIEPLRFANTRWLLVVFAVNALAPAITSTVFIFFVADRLALADKSGLFLALYFISGAASMPLWIRLARRYRLHALWLAGMVAAVASFIWAYWVGAGQWPAFAAICMVSGLAFGADLALPPALLASVIDANGHSGQREGSYFGLWNAANKLVLALAGGIALNLVAALGYERGATSEAALAALAFTYALVPCALKLLAASMLLVAWRQKRF